MTGRSSTGGRRPRAGRSVPTGKQQPFSPSHRSLLRTSFHVRGGGEQLGGVPMVGRTERQRFVSANRGFWSGGASLVSSCSSAEPESADTHWLGVCNARCRLAVPHTRTQTGPYPFTRAVTRLCQSRTRAVTRLCQSRCTFQVGAPVLAMIPPPVVPGNCREFPQPRRLGWMTADHSTKSRLALPPCTCARSGAGAGARDGRRGSLCCPGDRPYVCGGSLDTLPSREGSAAAPADAVRPEPFNALVIPVARLVPELASGCPCYHGSASSRCVRGPNRYAHGFYAPCVNAATW